MRFLAGVCYVISAVFTVGLVVWAAVLWAIGDRSGTFPGAFGLWFAGGLPFLMAGLFFHAVRSRRTSLSMPAHLPDGKRR